MAPLLSFQRILKTLTTFGLLLLAATSPLSKTVAARSSLTRPCKEASLWVPDSSSSSSMQPPRTWKRFAANSGRPLMNRADQAYKGGPEGDGLWYSLNTKAPSSSVEVQLHWGHRLYPGGNAYYALYDFAVSAEKLRSTMCAAGFKLPPLQGNNLLEDGGPIDTSTMSFIKRGRTSAASSSLLIGDKKCLNSPLQKNATAAEVRPLVLVIVLDYTNPKSRVLGRYYASNDKPGVVTSEVLCSKKEKAPYFRWLILGVACTC